MNTEKDFNDWFENSPFAELPDADIIKDIARESWRRSFDCVKNSVLELLLMGDK